MKLEKEEYNKYRIFFLLGLILINVCSLVFLSFLNYRFVYLEQEISFEEKFQSTASKEMINVVDTLDNQIEDIISIPVLFFSATDENFNFIEPSRHSIIGNYEEIRNLFSDLAKLKRIYPLLVSLDIYYPNTQTAVTNFLNMHELETKNDVNRYLPWLNKINLDSNFESTYLSYQNNSYPVPTETISYVYKLGGSKTGFGDIVVTLHINPKFSVQNVGYEYSFWIVDQNGNILYENSKYPWQREIIDNLIAGKEKEVNTFIENDDGKFVLYETNGDLTKLKYYGFVGYKGIYPGFVENRAKTSKTLVLLIIFNALVLGILTLLNYFLYKNFLISFFQNLRGKKGNLATNLALIKNEYEHLETKSKDYQIQTELKSLLTNKASEEEYNEIYKRSGSKFIYSIIVSTNSSNKEFESEKLNSICKLLSQENKIIYTTFFFPYRAVFTVFSNKEAVSTSILNKIKDELGKEINISVGRVCLTEESGFQNSFASAMDVFIYRFLFNNPTVLEYNELKIGERIPFGNHLNILTQLNTLINIGEIKPIEELIDSLFNDLINGNYSVQYVRATLADLVSSIYQQLTNNKIDMWALYGYDIRFYATKIPNIEAYKVWLNKIILAATTTLAEGRERYEDVMYQKINEIVDRELSNDISLSMLADELGMRQDALSRSFKSIVGSNYMEFITDKKMKKAVELLEKNMSINEISNYLGYRSPQYFIKIFKSTYGITPNKYRKH